MKKVFTNISLFAIIAAPAYAQSVSSGIDFKSAYILDDAVVSTDGPVGQGYASLDLGNGFAFNGWGSKGLDTDVGDELDLGFSWNNEFENGISVKAVANRYFIRDLPNMDELTVGAGYAGFDVSVTHYVWHDGFEDGDRIQFGYNFELTNRWSARVEVTGETGLELPDAIILSADAVYELSDNLKFFATGYLPNRDDGLHEKRVVVGFGWSN